METLPLTAIKGVGEARAKALRQLGVNTVGDLLRFLPRDFQDFSEARPVASLKHGEMAAVRVRILEEPKLARFHGMTVVSVPASDGPDRLRLKWYNQPYRKNQVFAGQTKIACGRVDRARGVAMQNPQLLDELPGLIPVYPLCRGLTQRTVRTAMRGALELLESGLQETLPDDILADYGLCPLWEALHAVHFPAARETLLAARRRLAFENMTAYLAVVELQRQNRRRMNGIAFDVSGVRERFLKKLPFALTGAQQRVLDEIDADMQSPVPMNRLVQGDVGSGKTAVALYALCVAAANGRQGALLAPTEILARQHFETLSTIFGESACLLTGNMKKRERDAALDRIESGAALCVAGTHALLQEDVRFHRLGLVVTDEKHRFGVAQRAALEKKGVRPDVLVMSATPIPRTLAMLLYGDLDVSVLDELPPGRKPVKTSCIPESRRRDMYDYVARQAAQGLQTYVVCPFIEPSDTVDGPSATALYQELREAYPAVSFGLLHGRMGQQEKEHAIARFRSGETHVLVTTTVIEVGVHVDKAAVMIIEGAERFGLAQLHQLRGRVGRGSEQAYCFLLAESGGDAALARLCALTESNDGFWIAERDLAQRGPGDFLGTRQHGEGDAALFSAAGSMELLEEAKAAAQRVIDLPSVRNNAFLAAALARYQAKFDSIAMN